MNQRHAARARRRAFTLVELLVVISIIALLISLLLPALSSAKESGRMIQCSSQDRQLAIAFHVYAQDYKGSAPVVGVTGSSWAWQMQIAPYLNTDPTTVSLTPWLPTWVPKVIKVMQCPSTFGKVSVWSDGSYASNYFFTQQKDNDQYMTSAYAWWLDRYLDQPPRLDDPRLSRGQSRFILLGESMDPSWLIPSWNSVRLYPPLHLQRRTFAFLDGHVEASGPEKMYIIALVNSGQYLEGRNNHPGNGEP